MYLVVALLALEHDSPALQNVLALVLGISFSSAVAIGGIVAMSLYGLSHKQRVAVSAPTGKSRIHRWRFRSEIVTFVSTPVGGLAILIVWVMVSRPWLPEYLDPATIGVIAVLSGIHCVYLWRFRIRFCNEARAKVFGQVDLYRNWDWNRVSDDPLVRFRERWRNPRWKPVSLIHQPAEAECFAQEARSWKVAWNTASLFAGLVALVFAAPLTFDTSKQEQNWSPFDNTLKIHRCRSLSGHCRVRRSVRSSEI